VSLKPHNDSAAELRVPQAPGSSCRCYCGLGPLFSTRSAWIFAEHLPHLPGEFRSSNVIGSEQLAEAHAELELDSDPAGTTVANISGMLARGIG
jgi:hypothetical protein